MDLATWTAWEQGLPEDLDEHERYTATLLTTLARLIETAPFDWGLTGGTALQSYLPVELRRYSTDLEIITEASGPAVEAWMEDEIDEPTRIRDDVLLSKLTPDGTLFVIHDYPSGDFEAAGIEPRAFEHFPIDAHPPPGTLQVPKLSFGFLLATKVYEIQRVDRGGERKKDAYDLALALPGVDLGALLTSLEVYAAQRDRPGEHEDIARSAGAWLDHFATDGYRSLKNWLPNYVPDGDPEEIQAGLQDAIQALERALDEPIEPADEERCRFLFQELSPADLVPVAKRLGFDGDPIKQSENVRDLVLQAVVEHGARPLPTTAEELRNTISLLGE